MYPNQLFVRGLKLPKSYRSYRLSGLLGCALALSFTAQSAPVAPPARVLITKPINTAQLVRLPGNTRAEATTQNDRGKVADVYPMSHMLLHLQRSPEREQALQAFIDQQHDKSSANFHKWLTAEEFGQLYGPAQQDIEKVSQWLRSNGLSVNAIYPSGMMIDFSGTAGQVLAAFHTEIHHLRVNGKDHIANMSDPQIPEALAPVVAGVVSMHDFFPRAMRRPKAEYSFSQSGIDFQAVVPADLATIYNLKAPFAAGYTGKGQTIAVVEDSNLYDSNDWNTFRSTFGLTSYTSGSLETVHPTLSSGGSNCADPGVNGADVETTADAEWALAAAPDATISVASCADTSTTFGGLIAVQNLINSSSPPQIISMSYGYCEAGNGVVANAAYNTTYQQAVSEGVSVFVAAGDSGAAGCDAGYNSATHGLGISGFGSTPYNVSVGGTDFADTYQGTNKAYWGTTNSTTYGSATSYVPEIPWNDTCASSILAVFSGYTTGYGPGGFCASSMAQQNGLVSLGAGAGGPSGCATGVPSSNFVVSGSCKGYAKPSWQTGVSGIPADGVRDTPDVSMFAATGIWGHYYVTCFSDLANSGAPCTGAPLNWGGAGGTSFASPVLAGIQALVNQKMGGKQGNPNPVYYKLAASSVGSSVFHAITKGENSVPCSGDLNCYGAGFVGRGRATPITIFDVNGMLSTSSSSDSPAFAAATGYNMATGLGTVDAFNLLSNWSKGQ